MLGSKYIPRYYAPDWCVICTLVLPEQSSRTLGKAALVMISSLPSGVTVVPMPRLLPVGDIGIRHLQKRGQHHEPKFLDHDTYI